MTSLPTTLPQTETTNENHYEWDGVELTPHWEPIKKLWEPPVDYEFEAFLHKTRIARKAYIDRLLVVFDHPPFETVDIYLKYLEAKGRDE